MDSSEVQIQIAIPVRLMDFLSKGPEKAQDASYKMIEEVCSFSEKLELHLDSEVICKPSIKWLEDADITSHLNLWSRPDIVGSGCEILEFSCALPHFLYGEGDSSENNSKVTEDEWKRSAVISELVKQICDVLICCNLSRVGSIQCSDSLVFENGEHQKYSKVPALDAFCIQGAVELAEDIEWPKLHTIEFGKVWNWIRKNDRFLNGFGGGATSRALGAFTRLFHLGSDDQSEQLMWSMIGIEALYGNGRLPVMEQIRDKTQVLLGKQSGFKKKISEMYDFRSRFMHGDMDFPSLSFYHDADEIYDQYSKKQFDAISMATAILVATLQEMILRDWSGLEFTYMVNDKKS